MAEGIAPAYFKGLLNGLTNKGGQTGSVSVPSTAFIGLLTGMPAGFDSNGYYTGQTEVSTTSTGYRRLSLKNQGLGTSYYFNTDAVIDSVTDVGKVSISNTAPVQFPVSTAAWSTTLAPIIGWALFDASTGGNCIVAGSLTSSVNVSDENQTVFFGIGDISLSIAPEETSSGT